MSVTEAAEQQERALRMTLMTVQIDKDRLDIQRIVQEMRREDRKLALATLSLGVTIFGVIVAAFAAGAAWMHYLVN